MAELLKLSAVASGFDRLFEVPIEKLKDLAPVLRQFDAWLRPEIQKVFDQQGPGWEALATASKQARAQGMPELAARIRERALNKLERSVGRSSQRAENRLAKTGAHSHLLMRRQRAVAKQREQLEEAKRSAQAQRAAAVSSGPSEKKFAKLMDRVQKYRGRAEEQIGALERGELLGRIASSIKSTVSRGSLLIESSIKWSAIHNEGGTAGNHAHIPKRTFLEWTPQRIEKFIEIVQEYLIGQAVKQAMGGS